MDRKKTILIAVLINAGLLVLLFVVALHHEDGSKNIEISQTASPEPKPLFNDAPQFTDAPLAESIADGSVSNSIVSDPAASSPAASAEIVHQLPPLAMQPEPLVAAPSAANLAPPPSGVFEVKVKKGDSLEKIAKAHRTSVDEIIRLNQLPSSFLRVGQVLKLPEERIAHAVRGAKTYTAQSIDSQPEFYTVRVGDNPWTIAMKHHMKVDELLKVNHLNEEKAHRLKPGDRLRIR